MIYWAPLLHFYQPPGQLAWVLRKVYKESYKPLVDLFSEIPHAKVTININGVLTDMLSDHGLTDVLRGMRELGNRGQVDFTGSGKHHPILPLIPEKEMRRQIEHNLKTNRRYFGRAYSPAGFFPPEMCYADNIVAPIVDSGHRWVILSGIACPVSWPMKVIHETSVGGKKLAVLFRDDILSNKISFQNIDARGFIEHLRQLQTNGKGDVYVVTAMDAETFGHHIQDWEKLFLAEVYEALEPEPLDMGNMRENGELSLAVALGPERMVKPLAAQHGGLFQASEVTEGQIKVVTISELLDLFPRGATIQPRASSWSTTMDDINRGNPYPLWCDKGNEIHRLQWEHLHIALDVAEKAQEVSRDGAAKYYSDIARALLDGALHSCQFWWASRRPMWDINMVNRGLTQQHEVILNAYRAIMESNCSDSEKTEFYYRVVAARDLRNKIRDKLFILK